ncbi:MAG: dihydrofolate reductase family protein [Thermoanaerobaculia bacterium]
MSWKLCNTFWTRRDSHVRVAELHVHRVAVRRVGVEPLISAGAESSWCPSDLQFILESAKDLVLFAGANIARQFIELDLFDEYRLMVHPIVLGEGLPSSHRTRRGVS